MAMDDYLAHSCLLADSKTSQVYSLHGPRVSGHLALTDFHLNDPSELRVKPAECQSRRFLRLDIPKSGEHS